MTSVPAPGADSAALAAVWLDARDDVATALRPLAPGESITVSHGGQSRTVRVGEPIPLGHKIALRALERGTRVRKYGERIGRLFADVPAGGWVHTHNLGTAARRTTAEELAWRAQAAPEGGVRAVPHGDAPSAVPAVSRDGRTQYVAQPAHGYVLARAADGASRIFADLGGLPGEPVATAVDGEDHVWVALADAGALLRYAPDGALVRVLRLPSNDPVALAFGPAGTREIYVTTRAAGSTAEGATAHASSTFVLDADIGDVATQSGANT